MAKRALAVHERREVRDVAGQVGVRAEVRERGAPLARAVVGETRNLADGRHRRCRLGDGTDPSRGVLVAAAVVRLDRLGGQRDEVLATTVRERRTCGAHGGDDVARQLGAGPTGRRAVAGSGSADGSSRTHLAGSVGAAFERWSS